MAKLDSESQVQAKMSDWKAVAMQYHLSDSAIMQRQLAARAPAAVTERKTSLMNLRPGIVISP
jgi:hypothetical protein